MTKLKPAVVPPEEIERVVRDYIRGYYEGDPVIIDHFGVNHPNPENVIRDFCVETMNDPVYRNELYQVTVRDNDDYLVHLSIKRLDKRPIHDWRHLQEIKNQLVGADNEAVELYPAETRVVDTANQYHLWVVKDPAYRFPFGFEKGMKSETERASSKQRPFDERNNQCP